MVRIFEYRLLFIATTSALVCIAKGSGFKEEKGGVKTNHLVAAAGIGKEDVLKRDVAHDRLECLTGVGEGINHYMTVSGVNHFHRSPPGLS